jgi:signal transduction histidine kinase
MMHQVLQRQDLLVKAHKLKAVGTLTAGVAHELNNPINNIMLSAGTLEEDYRDFTDEERLEVVRDLVSESERAQKIVRNLLDFARESEAEVDALDACEIVEETLRLAANQIKLSGTKVDHECPEHLPPLHGDRQQLQQVFLNMVLNALEAMPGGGELKISLDLDKSRERVAIEFQDTGVGIPEQHLEDIFDPFYSSRASGEGTGLGLSVSLGIIRQHGGDIRVRSRVGVGTTFEVLLPVARVPADLTTEIS